MKNNYNSNEYSNFNDFQIDYYNKSLYSNSVSAQKQPTKYKVNYDRKQNKYPQMPLNEYPINHDPFIEITKKPHDTLKYIQQIGVRYLEAPESEKPGDLIIRQLPDKLIAPAPPLVIRQTPSRPNTPPPLFIREPPPAPLPKIERQIIEIPGKTVPPPPRQVIVEKLPPLPPKPQTIIIDRWLPQKQPKRKVIIEKISNKTSSYQSQKNILINWESPKVEIERRITNLGVYQIDPKEYIQKYGNSFTKTEEIDNILKSIEIPINRSSQVTKSSRSFYKDDSFDFDSINSFSQIANKKRVSFQT